MMKDLEDKMKDLKKEYMFMKMENDTLRRRIDKVRALYRSWDI